MLLFYVRERNQLNCSPIIQFYMMRYFKWIGLAAALLLIISCFTPWLTIASRNIVISGIDATGTNYGKPGYFNLLMTVCFIFFTLVPRVWAKRANLLVVALNLGWVIRNFIILPKCEGGECPEKQAGIYLMLVAGILMLLSAFFPDMKLNDKAGTKL